MQRTVRPFVPIAPLLLKVHRWFADFDASEAESMSRKESRKAEKIAMRRAEDAVTAVNSAARAVAIAQHTEQADISQLKKARNKLKRAVKGLAETAENAPRILKNPSVDVFQEVHQGPTGGGSALERALRSAAASASPDHVGFKRRRLESKEETNVYNPSRAYLDALRKGRRAAPRPQPRPPGRITPGRSYNAREIDRDASCAIHLRDGKMAFTVHDEDLDEEEHLDDLVGSRQSLVPNDD